VDDCGEISIKVYEGTRVMPIGRQHSKSLTGGNVLFFSFGLYYFHGRDHEKTGIGTGIVVYVKYTNTDPVVGVAKHGALSKQILRDARLVPVE
jgi:hypothetical protein